jgi:enoyl-CoA hydratase/carnithine racemase
MGWRAALATAVGPARAAEMILTAAEWGLVNRVVEDAALLDEA